MNLLRNASIICLAISSSLQAQTVISNSNLLLSPGLFGADYTFSVYQNAAATNGTAFYFDYDGTKVTYVTELIDEGSDWYVVKPGDAFTPANIQAGLFTPIVTFGPVGYGPINVGSGDFWLGVSTHIGGTGFRAPFSDGRICIR